MSRVARVVAPGVAHHITQRGNRQADVFETDADRRVYLKFLQEYGAKHGLGIWAYCLMSNHIHLVAVPQREDSLGKALHDAHTVYALYFNTRTGQSGHLWQGRFYSCPLDNEHLWAAVRYVERNPVRAGILGRSADYPWSSAAAHCGLRSDTVLSHDFPPCGVVEDWTEWLSTESEESCARIRTNTRTGRPCGGPDFCRKLEDLLKRSLLPRKRGRRPGYKRTRRTGQAVVKS